MDNQTAAAPVETRYLHTVKRIRTGEWPEPEFKQVGQKPDGSPEYGTVQVSKPRSTEVEVFRFEAIHEPDIEGLVTHLQTQRTGQGMRTPFRRAMDSYDVLRGLAAIADVADPVTLREAVKAAFRKAQED